MLLMGMSVLLKRVQQTSISNLWVLTCGKPLYSPQFLESERMRTLLAEAAAQYDLIVGYLRQLQVALMRLL